MTNLSKALAVIMNLANYAVGIAVACILIFKRDFISIFFINGMTQNMALFFNLVMFQLGLVLVLVVLCMLFVNGKKPIIVTFPIIYMIIPAIAGAVGIYFGIVGSTVAEKILVISASVAYIVLSGVLVYFSSKLFQAFTPEQTTQIK